MRDILFRGKRVDNGEWVEGWYQPPVSWGGSSWGTAITFHHPTEGWLADAEVDPDTVGEFSGKCDDNDRRIFEGDIVDGLFCFTTPVRAVCVFKDGAFGLKWTLGGVDHFSAFTSLCNVACEVVVGNIYDNPELLEVEE